MDWKLLIEFIYDKVIQVQLQKIENSNYLSPIYPLCYFTGFYSLNWKMEFFFTGVGYQSCIAIFHLKWQFVWSKMAPWREMILSHSPIV